ncbi:CRISPR-associated endoribonuclease Cas6 [Iocasia frigidifontis]|uniref:CRISPR-associated endoribonuclease Cas6 n=1 Tax=Iocasia fonsfrigidae TaxID=2682810 RepID=A0A8A7KD16_9FIRM|nr:CRISPR-associated endoribonuclease Cas6 [Iocasia fonsfrigidae]QTL99150.1 CRISPR-associated endoribonuclease Cas6 [Iocasia fonsfrigidae]
MRLSCEYNAEKIPICNSILFVSLIKEALKKSDIEYFKKIYVYDGDKSNKRSKNYCSALFLKDFERKKDVIKINDRVIFNFSTPDYEFGVNLYNGLLMIDELFQYKDYIFNKIRINLLKEKEVKNNRVRFKTLSPICIKDRNNRFLDLDNKNYDRELNYIVNEVLKNYRGTGLQKELKFTPVNMQKVVVKQKIEKFTKNTGRPYYYVNSFKGSFELEGAVEDLKDIYQLGIGFNRSQGFGMLEVI